MLEGLQTLQCEGKTRQCGVSNLDLSDMEEWWDTPGDDQIAVDQLLCNLSRHDVEWDVLPWLRERRVSVTVYSPIEQMRLVRYPKLVCFTQTCGMTPTQVTLAWLLASNDIIVIPKTGRRDCSRENIEALLHTFTAEQLATLDSIFPPSKELCALGMLQAF